MTDKTVAAKTIEIFTDGACSGNPGPGGWGALLIAKAGEAQWQAAAWFLERKHPERWGRTSAGAVQPDKKRGEAQVKPGSTHNYYAPHPGLAGLKDGDGG